jgi:hypothetical protein
MIEEGRAHQSIFGFDSIEDGQNKSSQLDPSSTPEKLQGSQTPQPGINIQSNTGLLVSARRLAKIAWTGSLLVRAPLAQP